MVDAAGSDGAVLGCTTAVRKAVEAEVRLVRPERERPAS